VKAGVAHAIRRRGAGAGQLQVSRRDPHRGADGAPSLFDGLGGEPTLDDVLAGAWEGLAAHSVVACPVCGDDMKPDYGAQALPVSGTCTGCGTRFS
jgi:hypothetical protein